MSSRTNDPGLPAGRYRKDEWLCGKIEEPDRPPRSVRVTGEPWRVLRHAAIGPAVGNALFWAR